MASTRMSGADATWLHSDRPRNPMVVSSLLRFRTGPDWERVERSFFERVVERFPVFRSRPADPALTLGLVTPRWEQVAVDPRDHVVRVRLPAPGRDLELHDLIGREAARALDRRVPLWQLHLIEGYGSGGAVLLRTHHAMADGPALTHVLGSWADEPSAERRTGTGAAPAADLGRTVAVTGGAGMPTDPVADLRSKASVPVDERRAGKATAWTAPVPLERIGPVAAAHGATLPAVALAVVAGALRRCVDGTANAPLVEVIVAVALRPPDEPVDEALGNRFGLIFVPLPTTAGDVVERIRRVEASMDRIDATRDAGTVFDALTAVGSAPRQGAQAWVDAFARRGRAAVTDLAGPSRPLTVAGAAVDGMMLWMPSPGPIGLGLSMCSYAGQLRFGVIADTAVLPDPVRFADVLEDELHRVCP